jgi:molybdopterin-guanine dinucleotide biosynthesis protein A
MAAIHLTRSGAILAGGQATRFGGRDKSALLVDGRAILDRQIAALAPAVDDVVIVGGARATVHDIVPGCGPLGGLHTALTAARGDAVLLVAGDMPYLSTPFLAYLLSLAAGADIVVPQTERGYHPLCAVYTRACLEPVAARLADRRLRMRELVDSMRTRVVPIDEIRQFGDPDRLLANVNTPADYAGLETLQGHKL